MIKGNVVLAAIVLGALIVAVLTVGYNLSKEERSVDISDVPMALRKGFNAPANATTLTMNVDLNKVKEKVFGGSEYTAAHECYADFECNVLGGEKCVAGKCVRSTFSVESVYVTSEADGYPLVVGLCSDRNELNITWFYQYLQFFSTPVSTGSTVDVCGCDVTVKQVYGDGEAYISVRCPEGTVSYILSPGHTMTLPSCTAEYTLSGGKLPVFKGKMEGEEKGERTVYFRSPCEHVVLGILRDAPLPGEYWKITIIDTDTNYVFTVSGLFPSGSERNMHRFVLYDVNRE